MPAPWRPLLKLVPLRWREAVEGDIEEERERRRRHGLSPRDYALLPFVLRTVWPIAILNVREKLGRRLGFSAPLLLSEIFAGVRSLWRSPGYALGLGTSLLAGSTLTVVLIALLDAAFYRPFDAIASPDELFRLQLQAGPTSSGTAATLYRTHLHELEQLLIRSGAAIALYRPFADNVLIEGRNLPARVVLTSQSYFQTLGVSFAAGTSGNREPDIAVISHDFWQTQFGETPEVIGRAIIVAGVPRRIVGVTARDFEGIASDGEAEDVWCPIDREALLSGNDQPPFIVARLQDGRASTPSDADARWRLESEQLRRQRPNRGAFLFAAATGLVLFLASLNAAALVRATAIERWKHWFIRVALGASRWQLIRHKLVEDTVASVLAVSAALVLGACLLALIAPYIPLSARIDRRSVMASAALAPLLPLAFGLRPACRLARLATLPGTPSLGMESLPNSSWYASLVACQSAIAVALMATGVQFYGELQNRVGDDGVPEPKQVVVATIEVSNRSTANDAFDDLLDRLREYAPEAIIGQSCDCELWRPVQERSRVEVSSSTIPKQRVHAVFADPGFIEAIGLTRHSLSAPEFSGNNANVLVNNAFVQRFGLPMSALGLRIATSRSSTPDAIASAINGVVSDPVDSRDGSTARRRNDQRPTVFYPPSLATDVVRKLYIRLPYVPGSEWRRSLQKLFTSSSGVSVKDIRTVEELRHDYEGPRRTAAIAMLAAAFVAFSLAGGGLFGLTAYVVSQRRREIAVRIALGASPLTVAGGFLRRTLRPLVIGGCIGVVLGFAGAALTRSPLYGAEPINAFGFLASFALLALVMLAGCGIPALRAATANPAQVLRSE